MHACKPIENIYKQLKRKKGELRSRRHIYGNRN